MESFQYEVIKRVAQISPFYLVGGINRDTILNYPSKDVDGVITLPLEELEKHLRAWGYNPLHIGAKHPTLSVFQANQRIDFNSFDGDLEKDALRRDFTINAIYQDVRTGEYIDPLGGRVDIENKRLRACGEPEERFQEDPIRILRMVRFSVKYGLQIENHTYRTAQKLIGFLAETSAERITEEFGRILILDNPEESIRQLDELGYLKAFIPELARLKGLKQNRYHSKDAWEHTLHVVRNTPNRVLLRLAGLFHDLGKWETASRECYAWGKCVQGTGTKGFRLGEFRLVGKQLQRWKDQWVEVHGARLDHYPEVIQVKRIKSDDSNREGFEWVKDGKRHFLGHERESARLTQQIFERFRFSMILGNEEGGEKELLRLIENHMAGNLAFMPEIRGEGKPRLMLEKARRFAWAQGWNGREFREERVYNLLELWGADFFGGKKREPQDEEIFETIQSIIRSETISMKARAKELHWDELEEFAKIKGISGRDYGAFKEVIRSMVMVMDNPIPLNEAFLDREYRRYMKKGS